METQKVTLVTMDNGAAVELFDHEFTKLIGNCLDENADPKAKRALTLTVVVQPTEDRQAVALAYSITTKPAGPKPRAGILFIGREGGEPVAYDRIQTTAFPGEEAEHQQPAGGVRSITSLTANT